MNIKDAFPTKWLKADDIEGDLTVTIKSIDTEMLEDGPKPVVSFRELEKGLVLNKTNARTIAKLYGLETGAWVGKVVTLFATQVDFKGEQVMAIRIRLQAPAAAPTILAVEEDIPF